jgi:glycosyltransferase involved in cell wall biosynthesis
MKMNNTAILIVDSRGILSLLNEYDLKRHMEYAQRIYTFDEKIRVIIATTNPSFTSVTAFENLTVYPISGNQRFSPRYLLGVTRLIRKLDLGKILFIAGDPWESAISLFLIRRLCPTDSRSQVQIHADVTTDEWVHLSKINRIRKITLLLTLKRFESVRVTSHEIKQSIAAKYGIPQERFIVSNLRINLNPNSSPVLSENRPRSISFVGRLEKDRGLDIFVKLIKEVSSLNSTLNIVGSGPDSTEFVEELNEIVGLDRVNVWGEIGSQEMPSLWKQTGLLVSTAPSESFGRTIREAVCFGVPVLGVASRGFNEFVQFTDVPWVRVLDQPGNPGQTREVVGELLVAKTSLKVRGKILSEQEEQINNLVQCWISLLKNDKRLK